MIRTLKVVPGHLAQMAVTASKINRSLCGGWMFSGRTLGLFLVPLLLERNYCFKRFAAGDTLLPNALL